MNLYGLNNLINFQREKHARPVTIFMLGDVACLHREENFVVGCKYLGIEDAEVLRFWEDKLLEAAPLYRTYPSILILCAIDMPRLLACRGQYF